jgi:predicted SnoaL-like aldol condensation-catalyzing enzyme
VVFVNSKHLVAAYLDLAFNQKRPADAFDQYIGETYVQHNPHAPDGVAASRASLTGLVEQFPGMSLEIIRQIAEDDLVVTHCLMRMSPGERGSAVVDIVRVDGDRIVEHWDVVQPIPAVSANDNTMF